MHSKPAHDCVQNKRAEEFCLWLEALLLQVFISTPFVISFSTCLELRGCGEWNCQRARNRGVLRQAKRFLYNTQAGIVQAHWEGRAPGPELRGDNPWSPRPGRRLLISACLHILSQAVFKDSSSHPWQITVTGKYYSTSPEEKNLLVDIRNY